MVDSLGGSLCGLTEPVFELGEELLDRVQIGRVFRQVEEPSAGRADGLAHSFAFVRAKIVHDHDVAGLQGRNQDLLNVELKGLAVNRLIDEPRSGDAIVAQRSQKSHGLPAAVRHLGSNPLATLRPTPQRRHVGFCPGLVDEHQTGGVDPILIFDPLCPSTGDVGAILLGGNQRLFL